MIRKYLERLRGVHLSMTMKLTFSLCAIAVILLLSSIISILEYRRMSNYVSDLIASNINCINIAQKLSNASDRYNLQILTAIGENNPTVVSETDHESFMEQYNSLISTFDNEEAVARADSVVYSYSAYVLASKEMKEAILSDFIDARSWYFGRLQPMYQRLKSDIEKLNDVIYHELKENSETFEDGFYRSIMPGVVSVAAGLLLVLLLLVFIIIYYITPLKKMLSGVEDYRQFGRRYRYQFEGDDELVKLNDDLTELTEENHDLKKRHKQLREERDRLIESSALSDK